MKKKRLYDLLAVISMLFFTSNIEIIGQEVFDEIIFGHEGTDALIWLGDTDIFESYGEYTLTVTDTSETAGDKELMAPLSLPQPKTIEAILSVDKRTKLSSNNLMSIGFRGGEMGEEYIVATLTARKNVAFVNVSAGTQGNTYTMDSDSIVLTDDDTFRSVGVRLTVESYGNGLGRYRLMVADATSDDYRDILHEAWVPVPADRSLAVIECKYTKSNADGRYMFSELKVNDMVGEWPTPEERWGQIVINEIMATATSSNADYVELLNLSAGDMDLSDIVLTYRSSNGRARSFRHMEHRLFAEGSYIVFARNNEAILSAYANATNDVVAYSDAMPLLAADGALFVRDIEGAMFDSVAYSSKWHNPTLTDIHNRALERISPTADSNAPGNWASASTTSGGGTPGAANSQYRTETGQGHNMEISLTNKLFIPNGNGIAAPQEATLNITTTNGTWQLTLTIFSPQGERVAIIADNMPIGARETIRWDGRDSNGHLQPPGTYVVMATAWATDGRRERKKLTVTMGDAMPQ